MEENSNSRTFRFAVAFSFPGEYRNYIQQVDDALSQWLPPEKIFYDDRFLAEIAGFDADTILQKLYHDQSELIVVFLCKKYEQKEWCCNVEWRAIRDLIKKRKDRRSILPLRFDTAEIPGVYSIDIVPDISSRTPEETAELILNRLQILRGEPSADAATRVEPPGKLKAKPPRERRTDFWNIPYPRNPFFTGRKEVLIQLQDTLASSGQPQIISGLGGMGKTQTALEYAYRYRTEYRALLWARADSTESLVSDFVALATLLDLPEKDSKDQSLAVAAAQRWLETHEGWLLVFDNADDPDLVARFLPQDIRGHLLITSRAQVFDALGMSEPVELDKMTPDEAKAFLLKRTGRKKVSKEEDEALSVLVKELDYLPLALEQAGAYLAAMKSSFKHYLTGYGTRGLKLLEKKKPVVGHYPQSVSTTWALNFDEVERIAPAAADLLRASAFLHPKKIPFELLSSGAPELGPYLPEALATDDPLLLDEVMERPTRYSLIHKDVADRTYDVHRLVQTAMREAMDRDTQRLWAERVVKAVNLAFPSGDLSTWPLCERLLPHAQVCAELIIRWGFESAEASLLLNQAGYYLHERARYPEAQPLYVRALGIREKVLGPEHPHVAASLNNLGVLYCAQGRYTEAQPLYVRALGIREKVLGPEHPDVALSLNNLALLYADQGRYTEAQPLYVRALGIWEEVLGPEHPKVATCLNNLAELYRSQGRDREAEPLYVRALGIGEKVLGPEHPDVATCLNNLALLYAAQGRYTEAQPLYVRALGIMEKVLGPEHPKVAIVLRNMAENYSQMKREGEAERCRQRATLIEQEQG